MDLDGLFLDGQLGGEELGDLEPLVALELDDLAHLGVLDDGAVAGKVLFERLEDALLVKLGRQALDGGQGLSSIALLDADVCGWLVVLQRQVGAAYGCSFWAGCRQSRRMGRQY